MGIGWLAGVFCGVTLIGLPLAHSQEATKKSKVDDQGGLHLPGAVIPYSDLASPQAKKNFIDFTRGFESLADRPPTWKPKPGETKIQQQRRWLDEKVMIPWLNRLRSSFDVRIEPKMIGGVQTDIVTPSGGIRPDNKHRVLINLHGGGMQAAARYGGQLESVPIASIGGIEVITVDYRMAPEHQYPAASEDVAAVYRELLKQYRPENIGIYGCSAGAGLTGSSVAWFLTHDLPKPGAIGMFGWGPFGGAGIGDSNYMFTDGKPALPPGRLNAPGSYTEGMNVEDPTVFRELDPAIQKKFPPSLLITGTRDMALSRTVYAHSRLVDLGVDADLHVWEGAPHCSFAQPMVDAEVPESQQAWKVITRFFDRHLGTRAL